MTIQNLETEPTFWEAINLFERTVNAANWALDNILVLGFFALLIVFLLKIRSVHALIQQLDERCDAAFHDIDALLAERHALVGNLVETVKGFAFHEHKVLKDVIDARARAMSSMGEAKLTAESQIGMSVNSLFAFTENYPEIAAAPHFNELRGEIIHIEEKITASRRFYNLAVEELYGYSRSFPGNLIGYFSQVGAHEKFSLGERRAEHAEPVKVSFQTA